MVRTSGGQAGRGGKPGRWNEAGAKKRKSVWMVIGDRRRLSPEQAKPSEKVEKES